MVFPIPIVNVFLLCISIILYYFFSMCLHRWLNHKPIVRVRISFIHLKTVAEQWTIVLMIILFLFLCFWLKLLCWCYLSLALIIPFKDLQHWSMLISFWYRAKQCFWPALRYANRINEWNGSDRRCSVWCWLELWILTVGHRQSVESSDFWVLHFLWEGVRRAQRAVSFIVRFCFFVRWWKCSLIWWS
jgi:hypothetical protein